MLFKIPLTGWLDILIVENHPETKKSVTRKSANCSFNHCNSASADELIIKDFSSEPSEMEKNVAS